MTKRTPEPRSEEILRTACDVIVARGLANTRTADVAAAAGVSQALVFYHFESKDRLLAQAFAYAAEKDLRQLEEILAGRAGALAKLRQILRIYTPAGDAKAWAMWIDGWAESLRVPELETVTRRLDLRWKEALTEVIVSGVDSAQFVCADPSGAAWRLIALIDGLAVQITVHPRVISQRTAAGWIRTAAAHELGITPSQLQ